MTGRDDGERAEMRALSWLVFGAVLVLIAVLVQVGANRGPAATAQHASQELSR